MSFYTKITDANSLSLNKPLDCDMVYYSELHQWFTTNAFRSFSIKFVLDKKIFYHHEGREHCVRGNEFLVACKQSGAKAYFDNTDITRSICIDICPATVAEVFTIVTAKNHNLDNYLAGYFQTPAFYEQVYPVAGNSLGEQLSALRLEIERCARPRISKEWFMDLSERIIYQEYGNYLFLNQINSVKSTTKKELLRRLQMAKDYMDQYFLEIEGIKEIAEHCALSEYHFYRRFKEVYSMTPNQYLTQKKLGMARDLLRQEEYTVTQIAMMCSYPDVFTFSKAFKRLYGISPSDAR